MSVPTSPDGLPRGYREYVAGFCINSADQVLLIEKQKPAWQQGKLNGVGGKIEPGEKPIDAMIREFREETGLICGEDWVHVFTLEGPDYRVYFFRCFDNFNGYEQTTIEALVPTYIGELPSTVIYNLRWMLPLCMDKSIQFPIVFRDGVPDADSKGTNK